MDDKLHCKPIELELIGLDSNAFSLMGAFQRAARKQGRTEDEIDAVLKDCMNGDYDHLLYTLGIHCE